MWLQVLNLQSVKIAYNLIVRSIITIAFLLI